LRQIHYCIAKLSQEMGMSLQYPEVLCLLPLTLPTMGIIKEGQLMVWPINYRIDR
jgi:hypothetical protein